MMCDAVSTHHPHYLLEFTWSVYPTHRKEGNTFWAHRVRVSHEVFRKNYTGAFGTSQCPNSNPGTYRMHDKASYYISILW